MIATDSSTEEVYHIPVPREARTCSEAHGMIAGFDENKIAAQS